MRLSAMPSLLQLLHLGIATCVLAISSGVYADDEIWKPTLGASWWWQIENTAQLDVTRDVDMFDIDLFDGTASGKIAELRVLDKRVVCYFSAGTYEPWRPDASRFTALSLISESNLPQFDDEVWLNIGNQTALENTIKPIMRARLDLARAQGCDGVEPDNMDGYSNDETQGLITANHQLSYSRWLAQAAHDRGMSVALKNDVDHLAQLVDYFDFAINEQCFAYGNECKKYESTFLAAGKPVFAQEYGQSGYGGDISESDFLNLACPYFQQQYISALWKQSLNLDGQGVRICELDTSNLLPELLLKQGQWTQISLPANPGDKPLVRDIVDELPTDRYARDWVVYGVNRNDTSQTAYTMLRLDSAMNPGEAYWIIQTIAPTLSIRMPASSQVVAPQVSTACPSPGGCIDIALLANPQGFLWNMLGTPSNQSTTLSQTRVVTRSGACSNGCTLEQADSNTIMYNTIFQFDSDAEDYRLLTGTHSLLPWQGAWVQVLERAGGQFARWLVAQ